MFDWKKKAIHKAQLIKENEKADRLANIQNEKARVKREHEDSFQKDMKYLRINFKCCVCGKIPTRPQQNIGRSGSGVGMDGGGDPTTTNWKIPGDMDQCKICKDWACKPVNEFEDYHNSDKIRIPASDSEHIYMGICKRCAEKL